MPLPPHLAHLHGWLELLVHSAVRECVEGTTAAPNGDFVLASDNVRDTRDEEDEA